MAFAGLSKAARATAIATATWLATEASAWAQVDQIASLRSDNVAGTGGVRVGEGVYLRLSVLAEGGYDSNVFYNDDAKIDSPTLRITPSAELTNAVREGQAPPLTFSLGASLLYREYLSEDPNVQTQRAFNPTFTGLLGYAPGEAFTVTVRDQFSRMEDPPYSPGGVVIERDTNVGVIDFRVTPGGGRLQNSLRYSNTLDLFETEAASYASRMSHDVTLGAAYKLLPKTAVYLEGSVGYIDRLNTEEARAANKVDAIPYSVVGGLRGLITPKLSANFGAGYRDSIYDGDIVNPSGLSNLFLTLGLNYQPLPLTNLAAGYEHSFRDSAVLANFYDNDAIAASVSQQVAAFVLRAFYLYEFRRYHGFQNMTEVARRDHVQRAGVQADYYLQRWFFAGIGYSAQINRSTLGAAEAAIQGTSADYTKQTVLARIGVTY